MQKHLLLVYAGLLACVLLLRTHGGDIFRKEQNQNFSLNSTNETYRNLAASQNEVRVKICDASETGEALTQDEIDAGRSSRDSYRGIFGDTIGDALLHSETPDSSALVRKGVFIALILLFFGFTPVLLLYYCCYCCCDKKCPCCCRRDAVKKPFSKGEMLCMVIAVVLYCALTFSASIAGYVYANKINSSYEGMKCTIVAAMDDLNLEQKFTLSTGETVNFLGLSGLKDQLNGVISDIDTYFNNVSTFTAAESTNADNIDNLSLTLQSRMDSLKTSSLKNGSHAPNEEAATPNFSSLISTTSKSIFYDNTSGAYDTKIDGWKSILTAGIDGTVSAIRTAIDQCNSFVSGGNTYKSPIQTGIDQITSGQSTLSDAINSVDNNTSGPDTAFSLITVFLMIFYGIFIVISILAAAATIIGYLKKMNKARYILNISWFLLGWITTVGFVICVLLSIITILLMETCDQTDKLFNDKTYLETLSMDKDLLDYLTTCKESLGGNGKILEKFGVQSQIDTITKTQNDILAASNSFDVSKYDAFYDQFKYFHNQYVVLKNSGLVYDRGSDVDFLTTPVTSVRGFSYSLDYSEATTQFNEQKTLMSNGDVSGANAYRADSCISSTKQDIPVLDNTQCTGTVKANNVWTLTTAIECVNVHTGTVPTPAEITSRLGCSLQNTNIADNVYSKAENYVTFMTARHSANVPFAYQQYSGSQVPAPVTESSKSTDAFIGDLITGELGTSSGQLKKMITDFIANMNSSVVTPSTALSDRIIGSTGIVNNVNCLFFGAAIDNFNNQTCSNVAPSVFSTLKVMLVVCFSNFTLIILLYKMSMRFLGNQQHQESHRHDGNGDNYSHGSNKIAPGTEMQKFV